MMPELLTAPQADGTAAGVVVLGSGAAGLMVALRAADRGLRVQVVEHSGRLGGTAAVSGGMLWIPGNRHMSEIGFTDTPEDALAYLGAVSLGQVDDSRLEAFVTTAPLVIDYLEKMTGARFVPVPRPDYRPDLPGARLGGRSLDNAPFAAAALRDWPVRTRDRLPVVHEERRALRSSAGAEGVDTALIAERVANHVWTLGAALVGALLEACVERGVRFALGVEVTALDRTDSGWRLPLVDSEGPGSGTLECADVVLATGGFEWNAGWRRAYLPGPDHLPMSPPVNRGDGIRLGVQAGAGVADMMEAWWVPGTDAAGELEEGQPRSRHMADELCLPGSVLVNAAGRRFVDEATNYNDLAKAFAHFDIVGYSYPNEFCWMVFDETFRSRYMVAGRSPADGPAAWWQSAPDLAELAEIVGIDPDGLTETIARFNVDAVTGVDSAFGRGANPHDRYYGDDRVGPNPCMAPLDRGPYYALPIKRGSFGTKGGLLVDDVGRVLDGDGQPVPALWACGNTAAPVTGPGYPGAGATLASAVTLGYLAGDRVGAS